MKLELLFDSFPATADSRRGQEANCRQEINCRQEANCRQLIAGRYVSKNILAEKRFIYILMGDDFIRTITRAQVLIIHISGQNSPYDMKTEVLTHVNVQ